MAGILLIDDAKLTHHLFRNILEKVGYTVCGVAANGREGMEKFRETNSDLIFCDIMMEEMNGIDFLKEIMSEAPDAKVVICTSAGDKHHVEEARAAGAVDIIVKPIQAAEVIRITEQLIGKPMPAERIYYKTIMEDRAEEIGLEYKCVLDFYEAFHKVTGFSLGDERVDRKYLEENIASLSVSIRALLSSKMFSNQADRVVDIFRNLV